MTTLDEPTPDPETFHALVALAIAERDGLYEPAVVKLGPYTAFTLIGLLQLTWRHPDLTRQHRQMIEEIARPLQRLFGPPLDAALEQGWDRGQDVPR